MKKTTVNPQAAGVIKRSAPTYELLDVWIVKDHSTHGIYFFATREEMIDFTGRPGNWTIQFKPVPTHLLNL
jgi:hypothetical protein